MDFQSRVFYKRLLIKTFGSIFKSFLPVCFKHSNFGLVKNLAMHWAQSYANRVTRTTRKKTNWKRYQFSLNLPKICKIQRCHCFQNFHLINQDLGNKTYRYVLVLYLINNARCELTFLITNYNNINVFYRFVFKFSDQEKTLKTLGTKLFLSTEPIIIHTASILTTRPNLLFTVNI